MTVYADVLVVVNYIVNLFLLLAAAKLLGFVTRRKRLFFGALTGAFGSLVIFLPYLGGWFPPVCKLTLAAAMAGAAFGFRPWRRYLKALLMTFTVSFLFAGALLAVDFLLAPAGMVFYNGVVYFDISALALIVCTTAAYLLLRLLEGLFAGRTHEKRLYDVTVSMNGKTISFRGLADTGSNLKEPFSGAPVIVCDRALAEKVRPCAEQSYRLIPCMTVTGQGVLEGFHPDAVLISGDGRRIETTDVYIASSRDAIDGEYQALLNPRLLDRG